jgi:LPXTG-motif cell wall-anchored protein
MKRIHRSSMARFSLVFGLAALAASATVAQAGVWDKRTTVSFSQPVEVPGHVLPAGQYVMKLADFQANRHVVQFMNTREDHVYAAAIAIPAYRAQATDKTAIGFYEARPGQPESMRYWYYPGENVGEEFVYPKARLAEIAAVTHEATPSAFVLRSQANSGSVAAAEPVKEEIPAPVASESAAPIAAATAPAEAAAPVEIAQAAPPRQELLAASPQNETPAAPSELPKTGSSLPEVALLGLIFIGGALAARRLRRA